MSSYFPPLSKDINTPFYIVRSTPTNRSFKKSVHLTQTFLPNKAHPATKAITQNLIPCNHHSISTIAASIPCNALIVAQTMPKIVDYHTCCNTPSLYLYLPLCPFNFQHQYTWQKDVFQLYNNILYE